MTFNKKEISISSSDKKTSKFLMSILGLFFVFILIFVVFFIVDSFSNKTSKNFYESVKTNINNQVVKIEKTINSIKAPEREKYNILLTGIGGANHDGGNLTDTIILASINTKKNMVSMLSIPRDLYVKQGEFGAGKINEIYLKNLGKNKDISNGMSVLEAKIEEITGEKIDYYVNVDFAGFIKIVDLFNGIDVEVKEAIYDREYPNGHLGYTTFILKKGTWTLDGETALKYARSRHSTSDFDRSLRQQDVIKGLKEKIEKEGFLKNAFKIKELYGIFIDYVKTDLDLTTILKLASSLSSEDPNKKTKIYSSNLNNTCIYSTMACEKGGFLTTPDRALFNNMSVSIPVLSTGKNIDNYDDIKKFSNLMFNNPDFLTENYKINVFNSLKGGKYASEVAGNLKKYGFNIPNSNSTGNTKKEPYEQSIIYYNGIPENSETLKILKKFLNIEVSRLEVPKYAKESDTQIEIIIGNDYLKKEKITTSFDKEESSSGVDSENLGKIFNF